jgi:hypothetical protein
MFKRVLRYAQHDTFAWVECLAKKKETNPGQRVMLSAAKYLIPKLREEVYKGSSLRSE